MNDHEFENFISLADAAKGTPYSPEYLSLRVRSGKLFGKKMGRNWYTTQEAVEHYVAEQKSAWLRGAEKMIPEVVSSTLQEDASDRPIAIALASEAKEGARRATYSLRRVLSRVAQGTPFV